MSNLIKSYRRQKTTCPKCKGEGFIGEGKKRVKCPRCNALCEVQMRPDKNGRVVVGGIILGLFLLFLASKVFAKTASAADTLIPAASKAVLVGEQTVTNDQALENSTNEEVVQSAPCHVTPNYPEGIMQWCELITHAAHKYDIESDLIAAVMLQESGGDPSSYSGSGAVGLMQIMPRDGIAASFECISGPCFASRPTIDELLDPDFNIQYGANMLAGLINKLGSKREALKAYGPMDVGYSYADKVLAIYENYK